jgi:hypothetical protein
MPYPKTGDIVGLRATPAHLHWFDAATSERVEPARASVAATTP